MNRSNMVNCSALGIFLVIVLIIDIYAMKSEKFYAEMSKPYIKSGVSDLQRDLAQEVWTQSPMPPENAVRDRIKRHLNSIEFQATIGKMQEAFGFTDKMLADELTKKSETITARLRKRIFKKSGTYFTEKDLPLLLPRYSQLVWEKLQIYLENNVSTLVKVAETENVIKKLNDRITNITKSFKTLALGAPSDAAILESLLWGFDELLVQYNKKTPFENLIFYYRQFFDDKKLLPNDCIAAQKINAQLQNKVVDLMMLTKPQNKREDWLAVLNPWTSDPIIKNLKTLLEKKLSDA